MRIEDTQAPHRRSFIEVDADSCFPIQNLPYGVFRTNDSPNARCGVAIGEYVVDLSVLERHQLLPRVQSSPIFIRIRSTPLHRLARVPGKHSLSTERIARCPMSRIADKNALRKEAIVPRSEVTMQLRWRLATTPISTLRASMRPMLGRCSEVQTMRSIRIGFTCRSATTDAPVRWWSAAHLCEDQMDKANHQEAPSGLWSQQSDGF